MASEIEVEVVYACPGEQALVTLKVPAGTTAGEALARSGLQTRFPDVQPARLGIYGRVVDATTVLAPGDRLEIYRVLVADPKQARRRRARGG